MILLRYFKRIDLYVIAIILLYCIVLYCQVTQGQFTRMAESGSLEFSYGVSPLSSFSMYSASLLAIVIGVKRSLRIEKSVLSYRSVLTLFSLIMLMWFFLDTMENGITTVLRSSSCNPTIYFIFWAMFIAIDEKSWYTIVTSAKIIGPIILASALWQSISFQNLYGGYIGNSPQIVLLGNGICTMFVAMLGSNVKDRFFVSVIFAVSIFCAISTAVLYANRSWIVQCVLLLITYFYKQSKSSNLHILSSIIGFGVVLFAIYSIVVSSFSDSFDFLLARGLEDSRSWQYKEFFSQFSFLDLFFGMGTFATYKSANYGDYMFIDNTTILIWFHFGFFAILCLLYLLLKAPSKIIFSSRANKNMKTTAIICFLWFFALNGLSVYNTIIFDLRNIMMVFAIGRCVNMCYDLEYNNILITNKYGY